MRVKLFLFLLLISLFSLKAEDKIVDGVLYISSDVKEIKTSKYKDNSQIRSIVFPDSLEKIGYEAFKGCPELNSVTIPANVKTVFNWTFARCPKLEKVVISEGCLTIGDCAFYSCSALKSIEIPPSVITIGKSAVSKTTIVCYKGSYAETWAIGNKYPVYIKGVVDEYKPKIESLDLGKTTVIADKTYKDCSKLSNVILSKITKEIGNEAFFNTALQKVVLPETIKYIGKDAFPKSTILICLKDSYPEKWAKENGYEVEITGTSGISVNTPSKEDIISFISDHLIYFTREEEPLIYKKEPLLTPPYDPGELTEEFIRGGLNSVNIIRFIAGINADIVVDADFCKSAQTASLLNAINKKLSHYPTQPTDMNKELYELGYNGAGRSNLGSGNRTISSSIIHAAMFDGDSANIDSLGHRRWVLSPVMGKTGFGMVSRYYSMYVFDGTNSNYPTSYEAIIWPAQNMPIEYFTKIYPYSISLSGDHSITDDVEITMIFSRDNKVLRFNNSKSDGYFKVIKKGDHVLPVCLIWRPDNISEYQNNDKVSISIKGIKYLGELLPDIKYSVNFFNL